MSDALFRNAQSLHKAGNFAEAARLYQEILRLEPQRVEAIYGLGFLHFQAGHYSEAESLMSQVQAINPRLPEACFIQGCALQRMNRIPDALAAFDRALTNRPHFVEALINRGASFMALGRHNDALKDFRAALAINPANAGVWSNCGGILQSLNRPDEALACFDRALAISPGLVEALINRGAVLLALKRYGEAAQTYEKALALNPGLPDLAGLLALCRLQCCDWAHLAEDRSSIDAGVRADKPVVQPLVYTRLSDSPSNQQACAKIFARSWAPSTHPLWRGELYRHDRIRVAYISADFCDHATSWLAAGFFEHHDRSRFETVAVSLFPEDSSEMRRRTRKAFEHFLDAERKTDAEIAVAMRGMEIDIAVDLMGYAAGCRPGILALRPAPLQVNYLGYPGTMAASYVDYVMGDPVVTPDEHRQFYSEKIVALPDTYQCNDDKRRVADRTPSRAEAGLPEDAFAFCCFNDTSKITPEIFEIWMRLLRHVEGSVLWLLENNPDATRNLCREAEHRGIEARRLVFAPHIALAEHLARHRLADLFLDTQPYGAHTTASDALWAGLPLLTCLGASFPARVAASLLHAAGLPELITHSLDDYATLALKLAGDRPALATIRSRLADNRETRPLFDTARFTRNFEAALAEMYGRQQRGEAPEHFAVR